MSNNLKFCQFAYTRGNVLDFKYCDDGITAVLNTTVAKPSLVVVANAVFIPVTTAQMNAVLLSPSLAVSAYGDSVVITAAEMSVTVSYNLVCKRENTNNIAFESGAYIPSNTLVFSDCYTRNSIATIVADAESLQKDIGAEFAELNATIVVPALLVLANATSSSVTAAELNVTIPHVVFSILIECSSRPKGISEAEMSVSIAVPLVSLVASIFGRTTNNGLVKAYLSFSFLMVGQRLHCGNAINTASAKCMSACGRYVYDGFKLASTVIERTGKKDIAPSALRATCAGEAMQSQGRMVTTEPKPLSAEFSTLTTPLQRLGSAISGAWSGGIVSNRIRNAVLGGVFRGVTLRNTITECRLKPGSKRFIWTYTRNPLDGTTPGGGPPIDPLDPEEVNLIFYHPADLSTYFFRHNFSLVTDTNVDLITTAFSISIDSDSWTWTWNATIDASHLAEVNRDEAFEVTATINTTSIKLLVESISWDESFGVKNLKIKGRGINARLADPYVSNLTFLNTDIRTAQQLAIEALPAGEGWTIGWNLVDWMVAANAWSYTGTCMQALNRIAEAAGGYTQPNFNVKQIEFLHKYPKPPWEWNTVTNITVVPPHSTISRSLEWQSKPFYNAVWVAGSSRGGRLDKIYRTGTAQDIMASTVVDDLMTDTAVTTQRGRAILSDAGTQVFYDITIPGSATEHIIRPGTFVYWAWPETSKIGIVRSMSFTVGFGKMSTTVNVETNTSLKIL